MGYCKQFFITLAVSAISIICIAGFSYAINKIKFSSDRLISGVNAREYNSIVAKRQIFNAAIMGSSMSEGFHCSDFDSVFGCQSFKLTLSGCNLAELKFMADYVYKYKKLDYIFADCNLFTLFKKPTLDDIPIEIYGPDSDKQLLKKAFSINFFVDGVEFCKEYCTGKIKTVTRDDLYDWNLKARSGEKYLAKHVLYKPIKPQGFDPKGINNSLANLKKFLIPLFEEHPETRFILFFPPYSAMAYQTVNSSEYIRLKKAIIEIFSKQKNVELHDFQIAFEITENLNNYKDQNHYSGKINSWIVSQMKKKTYLVTGDNQEQMLKMHLAHLKRYDYQKKYDELKKKYGSNKKK